MSTQDLDFAAYLKRVGGDTPPEPSLAALSRLIARHAAAIPFENIEVLAGRVPMLDEGALWQKMVRGRRGGYCFEQNRLFLSVLQHLGYEARAIEARVRAGVPADVITGRTHMALRVRIDGEDHLADVGFGGLAPLAPLRLTHRDEQAAATGVYRLVEHDDELLLQSRSAEGWNDCYRFALKAPHPIDHELGNWFVATHPKSMLRQNLLAARAVPGGRLRLFNRQLSMFKPETAAPEEQTLRTKAEFGDVLADAFGLQIDAADLEAVFAQVCRQTEG